MAAIPNSGEIRARHETQLGFRVGGKIIERLVDAGTRVKAGQVLMRLDSGDTGLQSSSAVAQYQLAEADTKRFRELRNKGFVSQFALDAREAALKAAAQAGLARNQSAYTTLRADHAGVIAATLAEVGQVVSVGQPVLRLAPDGEREGDCNTGSTAGQSQARCGRRDHVAGGRKCRSTFDRTPERTGTGCRFGQSHLSGTRHVESIRSRTTARDILRGGNALHQAIINCCTSSLNPRFGQQLKLLS